MYFQCYREQKPKHTTELEQSPISRSFHLTTFVLFVWKQAKDDVSLSEGSTVDLRKPGEEEDEYSELAEEAMDPDNCFPDSESRFECR